MKPCQLSGGKMNRLAAVVILWVAHHHIMELLACFLSATASRCDSCCRPPAPSVSSTLALTFRLGAKYLYMCFLYTCAHMPRRQQQHQVCGSQALAHTYIHIKSHGAVSSTSSFRDANMYEYIRVYVCMRIHANSIQLACERASA